MDPGKTRYFVNKRKMWMKRKKLLALSDTLYDLHLHQPTPRSPPQLDRLSDLPDDILIRILSLLPMQIAVQTSLLSPRWRYLWKSTEVVDFHDLPFSASDPVDYTHITRCLDSIESPNIKSFTVVGHIGHRSHPNIRRWVEFALSRNAYILRIGLMRISYPYKLSLLPRSFFTKKGQTRELKVLFLCCVYFRAPRGITFSGSGFVSLQSLSFANCKIDDGTVELLLLKCLNLKVLVLDCCLGLVKVNISGANLKLEQLLFRWHFFDYVDEEDTLLQVDVPSLKTLKYGGNLLNFRLNSYHGLEEIVLRGCIEETDQEIINHIRGLIDQITQVKVLAVNFQFLQFVTKRFYSRGIPFLEFQNLEHLIWCGELKSPNEVYNLVCFLGDCHSLENCEIDFRQQYYWSAFCDSIWEVIEEPQFVMVEGAQYKLYHGRCLKNLKSVRIMCFSGFVGEMMLVRLLLERAVNLQKLELLWRIHASDMTDNVLQIMVRPREQRMDSGPDLVGKHLKESWIEDKVNGFPRASPNVQILFKNRWKF